MIAVERQLRQAPGFFGVVVDVDAGAGEAVTGALRRATAWRSAACFAEESEPKGCNDFPNESGLVGVAKVETSGASHSR
ncbi:hypothetical protein [Mycetocola sp. 2940]|uniref:hypothetical protein n=1 Tax=Mycetocola sp. 2940 TaxID=3156452 RepID=UPI0033995EB4